MTLKFCGDSRGRIVVELAMAFPLFLTLIFAVMELSHIAYAKLNVSHSLSQAARFMITGQGQDLTGVNPNQRIQQIQTKFCQSMVATGLSCANISTLFTVTCINPAVCTVAGQPSCAAGCTLPGGGANQTVTLSVAMSKPILSAFFGKLLPVSIPVSARTVWKNEPFN